MHYKKINIELVVAADEAEAIVAELNRALDCLEEKHTLFGGEIETLPFEDAGTHRRSALGHTTAAAETIGGAVRSARTSLSRALRAVV